MTSDMIRAAVAQTREAYEQVGIEYSRLVEPLHMLVTFPNMFKLIREYLPQIKNGKLLDVGCGAGKFLEIVGMHGFKGSGIDISFKSLLLAKQRGQTVLQATMDSLPFRDCIFDITVSNFVLNYLPLEDQKLALKEQIRVLKPSGITVFTYIHPFMLRNSHNRELAIKFLNHEFKLYLLDWAEIANLIISTGFDLKCIINAEIPKNIEKMAVSLEDKFLKNSLLNLKKEPFYAVFVVGEKPNG